METLWAKLNCIIWSPNKFHANVQISWYYENHSKQFKKSEKNNGPRRNVRGFYWCVKSCCSHFKLVPCYSWSIISPYAKFDPNWTKNTQVGNFHFWSILVDRARRSKNGRRHIKLILCCFCLIISPHTESHPNWTEKKEVRHFHFWSILVGRAGTSKNGCRHF